MCFYCIVYSHPLAAKREFLVSHNVDSKAVLLNDIRPKIYKIREVQNEEMSDMRTKNKERKYI